MQNAFHDILIHVRDFKTQTPAVRFGVQLAKAYGASVTGVYVCPEHLSAAAGYGAASMTATARNSDRQQVQDAIEAGSTFRQWATENDVERSNWIVAEAAVVNALAEASMRHDLLVLDRAETGHEDNTPENSEVVLKTLAPCMVVPSSGTTYGGIKRIAVGWNGSPEAMRAVYAALPLLRSRSVLLLRGEERTVSHHVDWHPPLDIVKYLQYHAVHVEQTPVFVDREGIGPVLLERARNFGAELLVMGAYGRSRFSEWVLGGATRDVLARADIPVLLRH